MSLCPEISYARAEESASPSRHGTEETERLASHALRALRGESRERGTLHDPSSVTEPSSIAAGAPPDIERVDPRWVTAWDELLLTHPAHSFFHSQAWARVLQATYGFEPVYFVQRALGHLKTLLPVMVASSPLMGRRAVSLPFSDHCELLMSEGTPLTPVAEVDAPAPAAVGEKEPPAVAAPVGEIAVVREAFRYARAARCHSLELRGRPRGWPSVPVSVAFYGHTVEIVADEAAQAARCTSAIRRAIRKARRAGLFAAASTDRESVVAYYRLHCLTRGRQGVPPQPFGFFENLYRHAIACGRGMVMLVRQNGVPIAGAVFLHVGRRAVYKFAASDSRQLDCRPNNLVLWEALRWYGARGGESLDLGRTSAGHEGLRRFKLGWGSRERRIEYVRYDTATGRLLDARDRGNRWHNRLFRLLPGPLNRLAGAWLYPHID